MSGIPLLTVAELEQRGEATLQTGPFGTQLKASEYTSEGTPVINVRNIGFGDLRKDDLEYLPEGKAAKLWQHHLKVGDIVFGRKGAVERHALIDADSDGWIQGSDCLRLRISSKTVSEKYLSYYLRTAAHQDWMQALCSFGATMSSLNQDILRRLTFPAPALATQQKIAAILSTYDDLIANNQRRITLLERMAEDIYREWFVRLRFPGHEDVKVEKGVPQGWKVSEISDVCSTLKRGIAPNYTESKATLVVNQRCIRDGFVDLAEARGHETKVSDEKLLEYGDVLINSTGVGTLGRVAVFDHELTSATCDTHVTICRANQKEATPHYLGQAIRSLQEHFESMAVGSTGQSELGREAIGRTTILLPPLSLQKSFADSVEPMLQRKRLLRRQTEALASTRDSLLPRLISGKLSVDALDIRFPPGMQGLGT